jgi:hypothetical protein
MVDFERMCRCEYLPSHIGLVDDAEEGRAGGHVARAAHGCGRGVRLGHGP